MENILEAPTKKGLLFRCHALGKLFTDPKLKADKEAGKLGETAKTLILEMFLFEKYGYKERIMTDAMYKGLLCEQDSMALVQSVLGGEFRMKNKANLVNKYISGTPDVILKKELVVEDIKTSENLRTFYNAEITKDYEIQLQGYMMLTGLEKARLIYCLVPTPFEQINNAKKRMYYQFDCNEENNDYIEICNQIDNNNELIERIPKQDRIKVFTIDRNDDIINEIKIRVEKARDYFLTLK